MLGLKIPKDEPVIAIRIPGKAIKNERLPSGREHGANNQWLMGATTPYGHLELITDRVNMAGIPGTSPSDSAPTVEILGEHGAGVPVYPGNFREIGDRLIAIQAMQAQK